MDNKVELIKISGNDDDHALAAWTSTSRELSPEKTKRIPELLKFLAKERHGTPFEHSYISFLVTADIASHIHCLKHRIGVSINSESARYKELKDDKFYLPNDWLDDEQVLLKEHCEYCFKSYHQALNRLIDSGFSRKRAKESARFYLPYANQIDFVISFNFRSFVHFQKLRNSEHAQLEIRKIAIKMLKLVEDNGSFSDSLLAFGL